MTRTRKHRRGSSEERFVDIDVTAIGFEGVSIGRIDGVVHFVKGALPGERVRARVVRSKSSYVEAETVEILSAAPSRRTPPCEHFGVCGGCKWQHLAYDHQAAWKQQHVADAFERLAKVDVGTLHPTLQAPSEFGYRNKMEFSFSASRWLTAMEMEHAEDYDRNFALGLHVPGRFDKVRNIDHCFLQAEAANTLLAAVHQLREQFPVEAHHARLHTGFLRHLVVRTSTTTSSVMSALITTTPESELERRFVESWMQLASQMPAGSTLLHAVNDTRSPVAVGDVVQMDGPGYLVEESHGVTYQISPFSFFQTNTQQLPHLVERTLLAASIQPTDVVWDLYCGTGTLSLPAARQASHVWAAELVESSILDARANAQRNGITNAEFHVLDLHAPAAIEALKAAPSPDVIIIDPPRAGMHPMLVEHLRSVRAPRISYVSCNPSTLARDCGLLDDLYTVAEVTPVDMFPQTYHVEAVARLTARPE